MTEWQDAYLLDDLDKVLEHRAPVLFVDNDGCCKVAKDVRTHCFNGIHVLVLVEEHVNDQVPPFWVVEEDEQRPVDEPSPLLQSKQRGAEGVGVNVLLQSC